MATKKTKKAKEPEIDPETGEPKKKLTRSEAAAKRQKETGKQKMKGRA